jgi:hypothetical protein
MPKPPTGGTFVVKMLVGTLLGYLGKMAKARAAIIPVALL